MFLYFLYATYIKILNGTPNTLHFLPDLELWGLRIAYRGAEPQCVCAPVVEIHRFYPTYLIKGEYERIPLFFLTPGQHMLHKIFPQLNPEVPAVPAKDGKYCKGVTTSGGLPPHFEGISSLPVSTLGQEVKENPPNGTQMAKKHVGL